MVGSADLSEPNPDTDHGAASFLSTALLLLLFLTEIILSALLNIRHFLFLIPRHFIFKEKQQVSDLGRLSLS